MKVFKQRVRIFILLALFISPAVLTAQNNTAITVTGSGIVAPLFEALAEASGSAAQLDVTVSGTSGGFASLCDGTTDITAASRPISAEEDATCAANTIEYAELLVAHNIAAVIAYPGLEFAQCLTDSDLNTLFEPSAAGQITNWNQLNAENPDTPLTIVFPNPDNPIYPVVDSLVKGDGLRADAIIAASDAEAVTTVGQQPGAIGVVRLAAAQAAGDSVKILQLDNGETGCNSPSAENVENRLYTAANRLFFYANRASLSKSSLQSILEFALSDEAAPVIAEQGFSAPSAQTLQTNREALAGTTSGRLFSRDVAKFEIPDNLAGPTINIGGAANGYSYMQSVTNLFTTRYPNATATYNIEGQPAGIRRLCNGETDIVIADSDLTTEQAQNCDANNVSTVTFDLGAQAVVMLANMETDFLACLTNAQLTTIWSARSAGTVKTWNNVSENFPETPMTLFAPDDGNGYTDLLLTKASGSPLPERLDVAENNSDPLYRAAATANVEGALTYMSWPEYQRVLSNNQTNIRVVEVDSGNGCVSPNPKTIADGSYPLSRPVKLIVSQTALKRLEVQSLLWLLATDNNFGLLENSGLVGLTFGDLPALRDKLVQSFEEAKAATADQTTTEPSIETTPEAGAEPTPEVTP